jgi:phosphatidylserine/phosphatidylglycerophosphate/cardiolipin synthase-like enzyme
MGTFSDSFNSDSFDVSVTGKCWMGERIGSISAMVQEALSKAQNEIQITAYSISDNAIDFFYVLEKILSRRIRVLLIVNRFQNQSYFVKKKLLELNNRFKKELILKDFAPVNEAEDLHAKLVVIDHTVALIGSANLTWKGMILNHEIMVKVTGRSGWQIGNLIDKLSHSKDTKLIQKGYEE